MSENDADKKLESGESEPKETDKKDLSALEAKVKKIIAEKLSIDEKNITVASRFQEDLGADSLDIVELLMEIEEEFGVQIPDDKAELIRTVGDAIRFIAGELNYNS